MLELNEVCSSYGQLRVLWDIDIEVKSGSITGLIGPNGAGKSTLLKTILGVVQRDSGSIVLNGRRIDGKPTKEIVRSGIVYIPEGRRLFTEMTVRENLAFGAQTEKSHSEKEKNLKEVFDLFPMLMERKDQLAGTLSGGESQLLALGRGLMGSPDLLMIDEPSFGLSPIAVTAVFKAIADINERGKTILIVEQNVPRLLNLASFAYVIENGRIVTSGFATSLANDAHIAKSYLGI